MKKSRLFVLLAAAGVCSNLMSSCSSDKEGGTPPPVPPTPLDNSFVYGDTESVIESVLYSVDENQKSYTFYFSPTPGLENLDGILPADDCLKIVATAPTGVIDLTSSGNSVMYKDLFVSSSSMDNVVKAELLLHLTSESAVELSLEIAMKSGETLRAAYDGTCIKLARQQPDIRDVKLTEEIFAHYTGPAPGSAGTNGYRIAVTNAGWQGSDTRFELTSAGYALVLYFYGAPGKSWRDMPTGNFTESEHSEAHTFDGRSSIVLYRDDSGRDYSFQLIGPVKIERDEAGRTTVTAAFLDDNRDEYTLTYEGELKIIDPSLDVRLPQLDRDIYIDGAYASGVYNGDVFENGTGLTEVSIIDRKGDNNEPNGCAMKLALFSKKFGNPERERRLIPGIYKASTTYEQGTWMPVVEIEFMGIIFPMGTYALYDDGTQTGQYAYAASGDIIVREGGGNTYTIEFDLQSVNGYSIRGSYTGDVYLENQSSDDKNDGTSTLENDYELDLSHLPRANCFPQSEIYVRGLGTVPVSTACDYSGIEYGYQYIQLGTSAGTWIPSDEYPETGKLFEGDILGIDLLVVKGMEDKITPGIYPITAERYPVYFRPGVCVRGYNCNYGTSMGRVVSAIGWGYPNGYYDPEYKVENGWLNIPTIGEFASIYTGTVTVEKADGGDNMFTFSVDGRDVLKHRITGSWSGPVYLGDTDTPVVQSGTSARAPEKRNPPSFREIKSLPSIFRNFQPYK